MTRGNAPAFRRILLKAGLSTHQPYARWAPAQSMHDATLFQRSPHQTSPGQHSAICRASSDHFISNGKKGTWVLTVLLWPVFQHVLLPSLIRALWVPGQLGCSASWNGVYCWSPMQDACMRIETHTHTYTHTHTHAHAHTHTNTHTHKHTHTLSHTHTYTHTHTLSPHWMHLLSCSPVYTWPIICFAQVQPPDLTQRRAAGLPPQPRKRSSSANSRPLRASSLTHTASRRHAMNTSNCVSSPSRQVWDCVSVAWLLQTCWLKMIGNLNKCFPPNEMINLFIGLQARHDSCPSHKSLHTQTDTYTLYTHISTHTHTHIHFTHTHTHTHTHIHFTHTLHTHILTA